MARELKVTTVWGLAGSGKTTWLANTLVQLKDKFTVDNTLLLTFSRMATKMLNEKLQQQEHTLQVSTFHSYIAQHYRRAGYAYAPLQFNRISEWFESKGFPKIRLRYMRGGFYQETGHIYDHFNNCRLSLKQPDVYWEQSGDYAHYGLSPHEFKQLFEEFREYMYTLGKFDYTETLMLGLNLNIEVPYIVIDEANDICPLVWRLVRKFCSKSILLVGDPNQNIYTFANTSDKYLTSYEPMKQLNVSHRCCDEVAKYASQYQVWGEKITGNGRHGKVEHISYFMEALDPNKDTLLLTYRIKTAEQMSSTLCREGIPHRLFDDLPFSAKVSSLVKFWIGLEQGWLRMRDLKVLEHIPAKYAKNKSRLLEVVDILGDKMVSDFPEADVMVSGLKRMGIYGLLKVMRLTEDESELVLELIKNPAWYDPKINIMNTHKAKGAEADVVIMKLDIPIRMEMDEKERNKIIYTTATRARNELYVVE